MYAPSMSTDMDTDTMTLPLQSFLRPFTTMADVDRMRRRLRHEAALRLLFSTETTRITYKHQEARHG